MKIDASLILKNYVKISFLFFTSSISLTPQEPDTLLLVDFAHPNWPHS